MSKSWFSSLKEDVERGEFLVKPTVTKGNKMFIIVGTVSNYVYAEVSNRITAGDIARKYNQFDMKRNKLQV